MPRVGEALGSTTSLDEIPPLAGWLDSVYNGWEQGGQFWFFTLYDNDEMADLTTEQCATLKHLLTTELKERS
jgi:hypothetical protein